MEDESETEDVLITNVEMEVEERGHVVDTPVFYLRGRTADGELREREVVGFRPYFGLTQSDCISNISNICNDRRVLGVQMDCSPDLWADTVGVDDPDAITASQISAYLTEQLGASVYHQPDVHTSLDDEPLAHVYCRTPADTSVRGGLPDDLDCETFESDVRFTERFLIDTEIYQSATIPSDTTRIRYENWPGESEIDRTRSDDAPIARDLEPCDPPDVKPRTVVYDIEVLVEDDGFPKPEHARKPITAIAGYDSYTEEYKLFGLKYDGWADNADGIEDAIRANCKNRDGFPNDPDVTLYDSETELLVRFNEWVLECDPDIFTGYNADGFDTPYLIQRCYNKNARNIQQYTSPGNPGVWVNEHNGDRSVDFSLSGRCTLDILDAYRKTQFRELDSYTLDAVAEAELGFGKTDLEGDDLDNAWQEQPVQFFTYNIRDTQATVGVEREAGLLGLFENLRKFTGAPYEAAVNNGPMLDILFLRRAYESSMLLPTNTVPDETVYHGAKVFDSVPGVHQNCVYPDLSSMYPNLFAMLNLGPETIIGNEAALEASEYESDDCFKFPVDNREFAVVKKGESIGHVDRDKFKGVKTPSGGVREMFDAQIDWLYAVKPEIQQSFIADTVDELIDLKNEYRGDKYKAVKRVTNCFTKDTDVLTPTGVRNIRSLEVGDTVYSIDPDTQLVEEKQIEETWSYPDYDGEIVNIQTGRIDFSVTPNHRMLVNRERRTDEWEFTEAGELNEYTQYKMPSNWDFNHCGERLEEVNILDLCDNIDGYEVRIDNSVHGRTFIDEIPIEPKKRATNSASYIFDAAEYIAHESEIREFADTVEVHGGINEKWTPLYFDGDSWLEFTAWYITEGSSRTTDAKEYENAYRGESTSVHIAQKEAGDKDAVRDCISAVGLDNCESDSGFRITSTVIADALTTTAGTHSPNKRVPEYVWEVSARQKQIVFDTLIDGDGNEHRTRYTTVSEQLKDDVAKLCVQFGKNVNISEDEACSTNYLVYRVRFADANNGFRMNRTASTSKSDSGVYCVTVEDNHTLMAGRNGKFQFVGQSVYGVIGDSSSVGKGSRLYNRHVAEGITLAGRMTITHTAEQFTGYLNDHYDPDAQLVGGDTDSSTTSIPNAPNLQTAFDWAKEATEFVDASYDAFAQDRFNFLPEDEHRLHVELESLASALFYMKGDSEQNYVMNDGGYLERETTESGVQKRYAQHIVWDDNDGWIDTPDIEDYPGALEDSEDRSEIKHLETVTYDTYKNGALSNQDPMSNTSITGFEFVRSDSAQITRDAQLQILTDILLAPDAHDRIESYLSDLVDDVNAGDVPISDLARPKGIGQPLEEYGWKDSSELDDTDITDQVEIDGGKYRATPGPAYRGAKYADEWFPWEELGEGSKPLKIPIEKVRGGDYPPAYEYKTLHTGEYPESPEIGRAVDAIAVSDPDRLPPEFVVDYEKILEKELQGKIEDILETVGIDYDDVMGEGTQVGLDTFA